MTPIRDLQPDLNEDDLPRLVVNSKGAPGMRADIVLRRFNEMSEGLRARRENRSFTVIGHRGASGYAPENTMASFLKAVECGVPMIECDVHETKDGVVAVIHDPDVARTTDGQGAVSDLTWSELRKLDAGSWFKPEFAGQKIPRIEEVFEILGPKVLIDIEVKAGASLYPNIVKKLAALIRNYDLADRVMISSFHAEYLREARELLPESEITLIYSKPRPAAVQEAVREGWHSLHPRWDQTTPQLIAEAHAHGILVRPWNFNQDEQMRTYLQMDIDGISSDFPDLALQVAAEFGHVKA